MPILQTQINTIDNVGDTKIINRYDGGLNTTDSNEILKDSEAIIRKNWGNDNVGAIEKVKGFTKANAVVLASAAVTGLFRVYQSDGTEKLLAICNGVVSYSDDDGSTFTGATGGTGFSTSVFNSGVNYNDLFFFSNATNNLYHYTPGTDTVAAATSQPANPCRIILKRADRRLLALVNSVNGSTLYYSKIDPTGTAADDWSAAADAGSIAIDGAKSEPLTGGVTFGAVDIIFKDYAAFRVWGYPAPQVVRMPGSPGCAAPQSIAQGDGYSFHLAHDGVWMFDGNKFTKISDPVKNIIDLINESYIQNSFGVYRDGKYYLFYTVSGATVNGDCLIYDVQHSNPYAGQNVWFERDGLAMNCPIVFTGSTDSNQIFAGTSAATGFVYRLDFSSTGADDTSNIEATYQTKYFNMGYPHLVKRFRRVHVRYYSSKGTLLFNWYTNRGITTGSFSVAVSQTGVALGVFVLGTDYLASDVETSYSVNLPDTAVGKDISIKITHDDTGTAPIIRDIEIEWEALYVE